MGCSSPIPDYKIIKLFAPDNSVQKQDSVIAGEMPYPPPHGSLFKIITQRLESIQTGAGRHYAHPVLDGNFCQWYLKKQYKDSDIFLSQGPKGETQTIMLCFWCN